MTTIWDDLLAADATAREAGAGGLHPRLRVAIEAAGRFPAKSSGPLLTAAVGALPQNVISLAEATARRDARRMQA